MRAVRFHGPGNVSVDEVPEPLAGTGDLVVAVRAASVCGTDRRIAANGHFKIPAQTSRTLGHEFAGDIVHAGADVTGYSVGDRVSVTPNLGCGVCAYCRQGFNNMCPNYDAFGITLDGGFADYVLIPKSAIERGNVFILPETLSYSEAALVEPLSCCYSAIRQLNIGPSSTVLVVGAGPIGACHVMLSSLHGAKKIIVANPRQPRLDIASELGADVLVNIREEDLTAAVERETDGAGVDVAITCVSSADVQAQAVELLATFGRVNFFAGLGVTQSAPINTNRVHYKALTLTGTTGSSNSDYLAALEFAGDGRVNLGRLISQTFDIQDAMDAMAYAGSGQGMKAIIEFDGHNA